MIDLHPNKCNICGGDVIFTDNKIIYGKNFGSGKMYLCTKCNAYVGTHEPRPTEALGLLANKEMRDMKMKCHELFDDKWKHERTSKARHRARQQAYKDLAEALNISLDDCHFGYFDMDMLSRAYGILSAAI